MISETTWVNTSITSISHIRNHQRKYINHINLLYQKAPESIHWSYQSVISEATRVNTSISSMWHQCFQGSRGERVAATSCHPPLQTFTVSSLPILSFRAPWLVGGCPNDLSLDWGARRIEAPRGWTSYGVGRIDLWLPYKDRLTFLSTVIFINISHRSTGEIWSLKLRVTTLIRPTRKVQM